MFTLAHSHDSDCVFYFDSNFNKYVAKGGSLAWRINSPGLVHCHSRVAKKNGAIGACGKYAIFSSPEKGYRALSDWLHLKKYYNSTIKKLAEHYQPNDPEEFISKLRALVDLPIGTKLESFSKDVFENLIKAIAKLCDYVALGNEEFILLPKITGKIENGDGKEDSYLIGDDTILTLTETINQIQNHRIDASIVNQPNGQVHLRSRPHHSFLQMKIFGKVLFAEKLSLEKPIEAILRTIGMKKPNQCIWGFINGISNTKNRALTSAEFICKATGNEAILALPNDTQLFVPDLALSGALKINIDADIVILAENYFRYLLALSHQDKSEPPIVIFAHSQGAIIADRALERLEEHERNKLRIFTLGGASFILPNKSHPDSHNYASAADLVCRLGSPHLQILALQKYEGLKDGLGLGDVIQQLAIRDTLLQVDSLNQLVIDAYAQERTKYYVQEFSKLNNITILDPDPKYSFEHSFDSECYQTVIYEVIKKYQTIKSQ